jgi:hypothetical protein
MERGDVLFDSKDWVNRGVHARLDAAGLATRLRWAIGWLADSFDLRLSPGSRLDAALRNLDELAEANEAGADKSSIGLERSIANHRSAWEVYLATVCAANAKYPEHPFTAESSRRFSGDLKSLKGVIEQLRTSNSNSRSPHDSILAGSRSSMGSLIFEYTTAMNLPASP